MNLLRRIGTQMDLGVKFPDSQNKKGNRVSRIKRRKKKGLYLTEHTETTEVWFSHA